MKPLNVLSLFDGMSCGRVALERAGIPVANYFASEIDKYAIQIAMKNYPDTIQLGDVQGWKDWDIPVPDLIIGGSPCQGFSISGKGLNFDDPRSHLFFEFHDILVHYQKLNPALKYMLENVKLKDIIENGFVDRDKSYAIDANYSKGGSQKYLKRTYTLFGKRQVVAYQSARRLVVRVGTADDVSGHDYNKRVYSPDRKSPALLGRSRGNLEPKIALDDLCYRKLTPLECERLQTLPDGYTEGVSNTQRYRMLGNGWTVDVIAHIFSYLGE